MLDLHTIKEISGRKNVSEIIIEKDYILDWLLWGIPQIPDLRNNFIFKGATSIHKMYFADWRFSEDLDFTTLVNINEKEINKIIPSYCKIIQDKSKITLNCKEISVAGENDNEIWQIEVKIEYIGPRKQDKGYLPVVKLHITNDEPVLNSPHLKILLDPYPDIDSYFTLYTYSLEEITAEKLRTVLHQRCFSKDVYDLWRLLKEYKALINIPLTLNIYSNKCSHRNINIDNFNNLQERIGRLKNDWNRSLGSLLKNVPDFLLVSNELQSEIIDIFSEKYFTKERRLKMIETHYSIKYKDGDSEIEVHGDKDFVESKFKEFLELKKPAEVQHPIQKDEVSKTPPEKKYSLAEYLKTKDDKSHSDKILIFAFYLEEYENMSSFSLNDIEQCYKKVRIPKTKNFSPYIRQITHNGYITEASEKKDSKKAWTLTQNGIDYVKSLSKEE